MFSVLLSVAMAMCAFLPHTINLDWRPDKIHAEAGDTVRVDLYAVSPWSDTQLTRIVLFLHWAPEQMELLGVDNEGGPPSWFSGFAQSQSGICAVNESLPPADGEGRYNWLGMPGVDNWVWATPEGTYVTTFEFQVLDDTAKGTSVVMLPGVTYEGDWCPTTAESGVAGDVLGTLDYVIVLLRELPERASQQPRRKGK